MIFSLVIIAIFVVVSIYFYFRSENLYRQLMAVKKESSTIKKESKLMAESFAIVAQKNDEFVKFRFSKQQKNNPNNEGIQLLQPVINNYADIFRECMRGKGNLHKIVQKCCENYQSGSYKLLTYYISNQDVHIKRMWTSNTINGFMSFIEAILLNLEKDE